MPKANDTDIYKYDLSISLMDYLFGSDADNGKKNKSYRIKDIIQLINGVNGKNNLQYLYSDGNNPDLTYYSPGVFFTDTNEADPLAFTQLIVNKSFLQPIDLTTLFQRLGELEDVVIKLDNPSDPNNFFNFKVISIEDHIEYFTFQVELFKDFYLGEFLNETIYSVYFDIKSATESDDLKLDKGGYEGTAQDLNNSIKNIAFPDQVLKFGEIVITGLNAFVSAGDFQWRLNQVDFLTAPEFSEDIDPATDGFNRTDILEGDNAGIIHLKKGTENEAAAPGPEVTTGRIILAGIPVFGSTVGTPILLPNYDDKFLKRYKTTYKTVQPIFNIEPSQDDYNVIFNNTTNSEIRIYENGHNGGFIKNGAIYPFKSFGSGNVVVVAQSGAVIINAPNGLTLNKNQQCYLIKDNNNEWTFINPVDLDNVYTKEESDMAMAIELQSRVYGDEHLQGQINNKVNISDYNQHFKGKYTSSSALISAYPTANDGDYAIVDAGTGVDAKEWIWDAEAGWIVGGATGASTTDALAEGSTNLYFSIARVLATLLTGISFATGGAIVSTDSVLVAFGKLQKQISDGFTTANIKSLLGITTLSGSNTGDQDLSGLQPILGYTPENVANKTDSYTTSSSTAYVSGKALVEGLGTKQNTLTNPVTGTFVAGRVPYSSSNSTLTDSSKLLWNNTNSSLEVNGNAPRFTLKNNLNNLSTYFTNDANGTLLLKNHQDKTLAVFNNPVWSTDQPQMSIGNVSSIPTESQLYVYGGKNGANIDARGSATVDEANIDLEGNDWETSPNSLGFSYFGSNATAFGTMMGYAKNKLGAIRFQDTNYAIINSDKSTGVSPIRFGINQIEIGNVNDKGFSYQSDFSSENISNPRWLTDKAYVDTKVPMNGIGASGTWGISISGNASSATYWGGVAQYQDEDNGNGNYIMATTGGTNVWKYRSISTFKTDLGLGSNAYTSTAYLPLSGGVLSGSVTASNGTLIGGTLTSGYIPKATGANSLGNSLIYDNGTRVGIGTTAPTEKLTLVDGNIQFASTANSNESYGKIMSRYGGSNSFQVSGEIDFIRNEDGTGNGADIVLRNNDGTNGILERMRIIGNGNVGIGNSAPSEKLEVTGTVKATSYTGSATLTGTPTAPTAPAGTNTTQIATTAFVQDANISKGIITTSTSITNTTLTDTSKNQESKTILISNGANNINYTINGEITASFVKGGSGTITFVQGSGRTMVGANGTLVFNGAVGSTASVVSFDLTDYVYINNL